MMKTCALLLCFALPAGGAVIDSGKGSPAVVLISGIGDFAVDWSLVQPELAKTTRTIAYDRATDSLRGAADELHALLRERHVAPPYVLVGHSWGGAIARVFAARYPADVAGMVLIESTAEDELLWINGKVLRPRLAPDEEWTTLWKPPPPDAKPFHPRVPSHLGPPYDKLPAEAQQARLAAMKEQVFAPIDFRTELQTLHDLAGASEHPLGGRPLIVLTRSLRETDDEKGWTAEQQEADHAKLQQQLAKLSRDGKQIVVPKSGHHIQLDQPQAVVDAVREIVQAVRRPAK